MRAAVSNVMDAKVRVYAKFRFALSLILFSGPQGSGCEGAELCKFRSIAVFEFLVYLEGSGCEVRIYATFGL